MLLTKTLIKINNIWLKFQNRLEEYGIYQKIDGVINAQIKINY